MWASRPTRYRAFGRGALSACSTAFATIGIVPGPRYSATSLNRASLYA